MNEHVTKDSFLKIEEVLQQAAAQCRDAGLALRLSLGEAPEPYKLALEEIADLEQELGSLLARFAREAPASVLETRCQYTIDTYQPPEPDDYSAAADQLIELNKKIIDDLAEQTTKAAPEDVEEALDALWRNVDTLGRKISMIRLTMQDN